MEKRGILSDFQCGFRSFSVTAAQLTVTAPRIARVFNMTVTALAIELDTSKAFDRLVFFSNFSIKGFIVRYQTLFLQFLVIDSCEMVGLLLMLGFL